MSKPLQSILNAAEDIIAITKCCPYHYLGCDDMVKDEKKKVFIETYMPWCDYSECTKVPGQCKSERDNYAQLEAWSKCWLRYWKNEKRLVPPVWCAATRANMVKKPAQIDIEYADGAPCPKCEDGTQIRRESDRGPFYGCTNFPECKFLKPIKEDEKEPF